MDGDLGLVLEDDHHVGLDHIEANLNDRHEDAAPKNDTGRHPGMIFPVQNWVDVTGAKYDHYANHFIMTSILSPVTLIRALRADVATFRTNPLSSSSPVHHGEESVPGI